jgi:hypothetical protein
MTFSVGRAMMRDLHMSKQAVVCAVTHGQIYIGEKCLLPDDLKRPVTDFAGQMLKVQQRQVRIGGSALYVENEQLQLQ